jgi:hypothetical protein
MPDRLAITLNRQQALVLAETIKDAVLNYQGPVEVVRVGDCDGAVFPVMNGERTNRGILITD